LAAANPKISFISGVFARQNYSLATKARRGRGGTFFIIHVFQYPPQQFGADLPEALSLNWLLAHPAMC